MGILENIGVRVGNSYVPTYFIVVNTSTNERSPIILGWPFLNTAGAIIYSSTAKIIFNIKGKREVFSFMMGTDMNRHEGGPIFTIIDQKNKDNLLWTTGN